MDPDAAIVLEHLSAGILAAEDWADGYHKAPDSHAKMIKLGARFQRQVLEHLKNVADEIPKTIDWFNYQRAVFDQRQAMLAAVTDPEVDPAHIEAYDVNVIINHDAVNQQDQAFIKVVFDTVASIIETGVESGQEEYGRPLPFSLTNTSEIIQNLTTEQLANLVGMKVDKVTGMIVPNPNPAYSIDETTRTKIANSIKTSIRLGENQKQATKRLTDIIADPARADLIAYTETVRAYAEGRHAYGKASGATGKYWSDNLATDICADNTGQGTIPIDEDFLSGDPYEPAHPHCKCITVLVYDSIDSAGDLPADEVDIEGEPA